MAIKKLRKAERFVVADSNALDLIQNPVPLAIWIYLLDKPENWVVRHKDIQNRFGIGRERVTNAMRELRELGLIENKVAQDSSGKFLGSEMIVYAQINRPTENPYIGSTDLLENRNTVKPESGKPVALTNKDSLTNKDLIINKDIPAKPKTKRKCQLPDNFILTHGLANKAIEYWERKNREDLSTDIRDIFDQFRNHHTQHGSKMMCWEAAWKTWYSNAVKFNRKEKENGDNINWNDSTWAEGLFEPECGTNKQTIQGNERDISGLASRVQDSD